MITFKLEIDKIEGGDLEPYFKEYGKLKRICYNQFVNGEGLTNVFKKVSKNINSFLDRSFVGFAGMDAQDIYKSQKELGATKIIFGKRKNFDKLKAGEITKDDWNKLRNSYIYCIGSKCDTNGNRKFRTDVANNTFWFCPARRRKFKIIVKNFGNDRKEMLLKIESLAKLGDFPITYKLTRSHLCVSVDDNKLRPSRINKINNRMLSVDLNPNYIGLAICDYGGNNVQKIIHKQIFDLRKLNEKETGKKQHEILNIAHSISNLAWHYKVESVCAERLNIVTRDHKKGRGYNKIVNGVWIRNLLINSLQKLCNLSGINFYEIISEYSSFVGCMQHPNDIDSVAAALEISRRGNLFIQTFKKNTLAKNTKIVFPEFVSEQLTQWKEEIARSGSKTWKQLYYWFKENPAHSYRILLKDAVEKQHLALFRHQSRRSNVRLCFC